ncbi:MAG: hypothetical protein R3E66_17050 [bacterium]
MTYLSKFQELVDRAEDEQYSPMSGPWLEEAWELAVEHGDIPNAVVARYLYMFAVAPIEPARALMAFSWCVAHAEQAESVLPGASIAQLYGIAIGILRSYPDYSLEQIETTFVEMENQYRKFGLPARDIYHHRVYMALTVGDRDGAKEWFDRWMAAPLEPGACAACDRGTQVLFHLHREAFDTGLQLAEPLLNSQLGCPHGQPLMTHAAVLVPMIRNNAFERAELSYRVTTHLMTDVSYAGIWVVGRQLGYLSLAGQLDEALQNFDRFAGYGLLKGTPGDRFGFLLSLKSLTRLAVERQNAGPIVSTLRHVGVVVPDGDAALRWVTAEVKQLADAFDRRNRNGEFSRIVSVFDQAYEALAEHRRLS